MVSLAKNLTWLTTETPLRRDLLRRSPLCQLLNLVTGQELGMENSSLRDTAVMAWVWFGLNALMISRLRQAS